MDHHGMLSLGAPPEKPKDPFKNAVHKPEAGLTATFSPQTQLPPIKPLMGVCYTDDTRKATDNLSASYNA